MDKFVPACRPLKAEYDACMDEWVESKQINATFGAAHPCEQPFGDYKDCVTLGMKLRRSGGSGGGGSVAVTSGGGGFPDNQK